jgi:TRAP-type C4-dicarboxylate transport system substrate-binding protein
MSALSLRLGGYQPARSVHTRALHLLADTIRQHLGNRIDIRLTGNITAMGYRAEELLAMTEGDALDICYFASSYLTARVPSLALFDRPFRFTSRMPAYALLDGTTGQRITDDIACDTGLRVLAFWDNGFRHISNNCHPIRHPDDCIGLRIRTLDNAMHQAFFGRLGFDPVFIDVKDLPTATANGSIDAQENPLTNIINFGLHRHHRYLSLTGHLFGVAMLLVNRHRYDAWPDEVRAAIADAATLSAKAQRRDAEAEDETCFAQLFDDGVEIVSGAALDRAAFERIARTM